MKWSITVLLSIVLSNAILLGQTCCSGGVPVSSNLGMPDVDGKVFQLNVGLDHSSLKKLLNERSILNDQSRERLTNSFLVELGYSFGKKWSIDLFTAFVQQIRNIHQFSNINQAQTLGLGDIAMLVKYKLISKNGLSWSIGIGPKLPTGPSDLRNENGLRYVTDLQPGSGALDGLFWTNIRKRIAGKPSANITFQNVIAIKGVNNRYLGTERYRFGNEIQTTLSISDRWLVKKNIIDPALSFRYRKAFVDKINEGELPSTGGQWIFIEPGLTYWVGDQQNFSLTYSLPIYAEVVGTQLSPSFRINISYYRKFKLKEKQNSIPNVIQF